MVIFSIKTAIRQCKMHINYYHVICVFSLDDNLCYQNGTCEQKHVVHRTYSRRKPIPDVITTGVITTGVIVSGVLAVGGYPNSTGDQL